MVNAVLPNGGDAVSDWRFQTMSSVSDLLCTCFCGGARDWCDRMQWIDTTKFNQQSQFDFIDVFINLILFPSSIFMVWVRELRQGLLFCSSFFHLHEIEYRIHCSRWCVLQVFSRKSNRIESRGEGEVEWEKCNWRGKIVFVTRLKYFLFIFLFVCDLY